MKKLTVFASLLLLSLVVTPRISAKEPHLLYAIDANDNELVAFSLEAQRIRVIGDIVIPGALALAFCPPGGVPYTITRTFNPDKAQLATLNLGTGAATPVGSSLPPLPLHPKEALDIMGMTCSREGTLYAIGDFDPADPDFNSLYTINRETGQPTRIGSTGVQVPAEQDFGFGFFMALAFAPDGTLYGANDFALYRINTLTGHATKVVDFVGVTQPPSVMGLAIDSDGNFYVADFVDLPPGSKIYQVDATGAATSILNTGLAFVHNITFRTPIQFSAERP